MSDQPTPEQAAEQFAEAVSVRVAGMTHQRLGAFAKSLSCFAISREIFTHLGNHAQVGWTLQNEGNVLDLLSRHSEAITCFDQAEQAMRASSEPKGWPLMYRRRGDVLRRLGRNEEAMTQYDQGLAAYRGMDEYNGIINTLSSRAEAWLDRGDFPAAQADLDEAAHLLLTHPRRPSEFDCLLLCRRARCAAALDHEESAKSLASEAQSLIGELSLTQDHGNPDVTVNIRRVNELF